jgi:uncharacterized protein YlbG (UPF0298 family)
MFNYQNLKKYTLFFFLKNLNTWILFVEYIKFQKKLKRFGELLIRKKTFEIEKTTCPQAFLQCFKHIKKLLKHGEFS